MIPTNTWMYERELQDRNSTSPAMNDPPPPYNTNIPKYDQGGLPPQAPPQYQVNQGMGERQPIFYQQPTYLQAPPPSTVIIQSQPSVILVGGCPACRVGVLQDDFTCLGVFCAFFFFPLGILCCLAMRERRCPNCGAVFG